MSDKKQIIKEFLESITDDIGAIDGGCGACISEFIEGVNEKTEPIGVMIFLNPKKDRYPFKGIEIVEIRNENP